MQNKGVFLDLQNIATPPTNINVLGKFLPQEDKFCLTVIGSRNMSSYGKNVLNCFIPEFVKAGITIVSGLAPGCDSYAQELALKCGGRTIGVLGFGFGEINSVENKYFIRKVIKNKNCVVISTFSYNQKPTKETFIYRNSIMAALGVGVLVVEAGVKSGTFHTVNAALDLGKDIFSVPGDIFRYQSMGCNKLINEGAIMAVSPEEVISKIK